MLWAKNQHSTSDAYNNFTISTLLIGFHEMYFIFYPADMDFILADSL